MINEEIAKGRYFEEWEDWASCCDRVSRAVAQPEGMNARLHAERFRDIIFNKRFCPGGRILRNAGRSKPQLLNCFCLGVEDSTPSIGKLYQRVFEVSSYGGGVGINFSNLRPKGFLIRGKGGTASGPVSFLEVVNAQADTVKSGGERRAALLGVLNIDHPDVEMFLEAKVNPGRGQRKLTNFNISIGITDEFLEAVKKDARWPLRFGAKTTKVIRAKELWDKCVESAFNCGDPGFINLSKINEMNPTSYFENLRCTNPCSELPLPDFGSCCLGSINLNEHWDGNTGVDMKKLRDTITVAVRFLDNVLAINQYVLGEIEEVSLLSRRIGLGVMGFHHLLIKCGLIYGSDESLEFVSNLFRDIRDYAYIASSDLALEKTSFPRFDVHKYMNGNFVKKLPRKVTMRIRKQGIANATILTVPPTGTTSMLFDTSSSIEPIPAVEYERKVRTEDGVKTMKIQDPLWATGKYDPKLFVVAHDIPPERHLEIEAAILEYVDSSISKTVNIPENANLKSVSETLFEFLPHLKGVTIYRDNTHPDQPIVGCKSGKCEV